MEIFVEEAVGALMENLLDSDPVRRHGRPVLHRDPVPAGQMGADGGWVELAVTSGLDISTIVVAIAAWLRPRVPHSTQPRAGQVVPKVVIRHRGVEVRMTDASTEAITAVISTLEQPPADS